MTLLWALLLSLITKEIDAFNLIRMTTVDRQGAGTRRPVDVYVWLNGKIYTCTALPTTRATTYTMSLGTECTDLGPYCEGDRDGQVLIDVPGNTLWIETIEIQQSIEYDSTTYALTDFCIDNNTFVASSDMADGDGGNLWPGGGNCVTPDIRYSGFIVGGALQMNQQLLDFMPFDGNNVAWSDGTGISTEPDTCNPTVDPTINPSIYPTKSPSYNPTKSPSYKPSKSPTYSSKKESSSSSDEVFAGAHDLETVLMNDGKKENEDKRELRIDLNSITAQHLWGIVIVLVVSIGAICWCSNRK